MINPFPKALFHPRLCVHPSAPVLLILLTLLCLPGLQAGPLRDAFLGWATFVEDEAFQPPAECRFHAEYTTAFFDGKYHMYYRTFRHPDGSYGDIAGIGLATSIDGNVWTAYNGGRPVIGNRPYTTSGGSYEIMSYAPSVIADTDGAVPVLRLVCEVMDTGVTMSGTRPRHWIEGYTSTDGITWAPLTDNLGGHRKVLLSAAPWEGFVSSSIHSGNVGTPSLHKIGGQYHVFYHGFRGTDGPGALGRGFASGPSLESLSRSPANPVLTVPGPWADVGTGRSDITYEDGYWYMVLEGMGQSALCGPALTSWNLARSTDLVNWEYSRRNPVRLDRVAGGCGEDMPAFQVIGSQTYVVTTTSDLSETPAARRYRIAPRYRTPITTSVVAMAAPASGDGYWQMTADGRVVEWGTAEALSAPLQLDSSIRANDIVSAPAGQGYWIVLSNGGVRAFGTATAFGSMEGAPLAKPVRSLVPTSSGQGYWLVAEDGGIFTFGNAPFHGSLGASPPESPVVAMTARPGNDGYWMVSSSGQVYRFGAAASLGSLPGTAAPAVAIRSTASGNGYWILTQDGQVHRFGDAAVIGTTGGASPSPLTGMALRRTSGAVTGCWLTAADGGIVEFGTARYHGDPHFHTPVPSACTDWVLYD